MRIQYFSDIHLEFGSKVRHILDKIVKNANICVIPGDIGYPFQSSYKQFLDGISKIFEHIIIINGNHEYYQLGEQKEKTMNEIKIMTKEICSSIPNVHYLDNSYIDLPCNDTGKIWRFIGTTLWSHIYLRKYTVNDIVNINEFTVENNNDWYKENISYLENSINNSKHDCIIITHHLPSFNLIDKEYKSGQYQYYNQCFASNSEHLIKSPVKAWIYGHTHKPSKEMINDVLCVCNPIGYPNERNPLEINFNETINI